MSQASEPTDLIVKAAGLTKIYQRGREQVRALDGVTFRIQRGEFVAVLGPSGSGKSTLLNIVGCMDAPTSGSLELAGRSVQDLNESARTQMRRKEIGFVFQHFGLLPTLTVAENVSLPTLFASRRGKERVTELLEKVGLVHRHKHLPKELSGGEMQRVAIARALINEPALLLADEPTGNLDTKTGETIIALFEKLNREGLTIVVVTHNPAFAEAAHRQVHLVDGRINVPHLQSSLAVS
jgi:putative ABC transport system ATP-binding protein